MPQSLGGLVPGLCPQRRCFRRRPQFSHEIDIAPTILEAAGIPEPTIYNGIAQKPMEGTSLVYTFAKGAETAPGRHETQYFEMFGHRALYKDGMMASAFHNRMPSRPGGLG